MTNQLIQYPTKPFLWHFFADDTLIAMLDSRSGHITMLEDYQLSPELLYYFRLRVAFDQTLLHNGQYN